MVKRRLGALSKVDADLLSLRSQIRRDPPSYASEFSGQLMQFTNLRQIFLTAPSSTAESGILSLRDLIDFIAHVADCYPDLTRDFPGQLIDILTAHHAHLDGELREKIVGSLVLLGKKNIIDSTLLLQCLLPLLTSTPSKHFRAILYQKIISDLRSSNAKGTNHKLNRSVQTLLHNLVVSDRASSKGLWAVKITRELWKRQVWSESKAVEVMKEAALSDNEKVVTGGVRFFLGGDQEREELQDESSNDEGIDIGKVKHQIGINKKSKKASRALEKATATVRKKEKKKSQPHLLNFSALHLLNDPQGFAETLFSKHLQNSRSKLNLQQKLPVLQLVSRLIGLHRLTVISFYSYFLKYITPKQPSVTSFLASLAQSTHNLVPPDLLEPLVQKIANEFVSEGAAGEVAAAGLNAIREICARQPLAMNDTLLQDLVGYRKSKDKGVVMAAKGLLSLYRQVGADMLKKRDRGKEATMGLRSGETKQHRFGEEEVGEIEGLGLLEQWKIEERRRKRLEQGLPSDGGEEGDTDEDDWNAWDLQDNDSDDSGGWIDVESDKDIDISDSDSDDERPAQKKVRFDDSNASIDNQDNVPSGQIESKSSLATTRILTPADLTKLQELRNTAAVASQLNNGRKSHHTAASQAGTSSTRHADDPLTAAGIEGLASLSRGKLTREEKLKALQESREEAPEHKSKAARKQERKADQGKSTTNKEKARKKNFLMTLGKARKKGKRSLVEQRKVLKIHHERGKRGGRRGNQ